MQTLFYIFIFLMYAIVFGISIYHFIKGNKKHKLKCAKDDKDKTSSSINVTALDLIRNQYFPRDVFTDNDFYIHGFMAEVFNIFTRLSPSIISTLTKVERRMIALKVVIENPMIDENFIKTEIENIDTILNELVKASHSMIEKLEEYSIDINPEIEHNKVKLNSDAVRAYMNAVNILADLTDNHSILNYEIHAKLVTKYPDLIEPFRIISGKVTYLFFVNLISYSNKIDQNIFISDYE